MGWASSIPGLPDLLARLAWVLQAIELERMLDLVLVFELPLELMFVLQLVLDLVPLCSWGRCL